jgi:cytochrome c oxidase cbb3-type subunit 2
VKAATGKHDVIERNIGLLIALCVAVVSVGGLVEIVPLFFQKATTQPVSGLKPYTAVQLAGRDIYIREGCSNCHSQMIRPFRAETERYGRYSVAGEFVYDRPFLWGSKRTGPDLARVGARYSDEWHRVHLMNPRDRVPYTEDEIALAAASLKDKTEMDALIAYLQGLGTARSNGR